MPETWQFSLAGSYYSHTDVIGWPRDFHDFQSHNANASLWFEVVVALSQTKKSHEFEKTFFLNRKTSGGWWSFRVGSATRSSSSDPAVSWSKKASCSKLAGRVSTRGTSSSSATASCTRPTRGTWPLTSARSSWATRFRWRHCGWRPPAGPMTSRTSSPSRRPWDLAHCEPEPSR